MRLSTRTLVAIGLSGGLSILACSSAESPTSSSGPLAQSDPPQVQARPDEPTAATVTGGACEELGSLVGSALSATVSKNVESTSFPLVNRPTPSRLKVIAVGDPTTISPSAVLGVDKNSNYDSCTHCLVIAMGCGSADCKDGAWFFPRSGTANLLSTAGSSFHGSFKDVTLEEVRIDAQSLKSTPVPNGACLHVAELTFDATAIGSASSSSGGSSSSSGGSSGTNDTSALDAGVDSGGTGTNTSGGTGKGGEGGDGNTPDVVNAKRSLL